MKTFDLIIVGGGINGAGIAADAAGRGLSVLLVEQHDFASGTSSASSKLIHGGLRYLESYEFRLVRKALHERHTLQQCAPHLIKPMRFIVPNNSKVRKPWLLRLGLWCYDLLSFGDSLPKSKAINLKKGYHLKKQFKKGYSYYDCATDDARLVIENILQANKYGAETLNYHRCDKIEKENQLWKVTLQDGQSHYAKALVNATGPWSNHFNNKVLNIKLPSVELVKGSHLVVKKFYDQEDAFLLQNDDGRVVFVIPYYKDYLLIGTTDISYHGDPQAVKIDCEEIDYLFKVVNEYFEVSLTEEHIIDSFSGVRPLIAEKNTKASKLSRDYHIELSEQDSLPLITLYGGKITTYRKLAEQAVDLLKPYFKEMKPAWTATAKLPGAKAFSVHQLEKKYPWLPSNLLERYMRTYGCRIELLLRSCNSLDALGESYGHDLYEREIKFLIQNEFCQTQEDLLWRRTKLGLVLRDFDSRFFE